MPVLPPRGAMAIEAPPTSQPRPHIPISKPKRIVVTRPVSRSRPRPKATLVEDPPTIWASQVFGVKLVEQPQTPQTSLQVEKPKAVDEEALYKLSLLSASQKERFVADATFGGENVEYLLAVTPKVEVEEEIPDIEREYGPRGAIMHGTTEEVKQEEPETKGLVEEKARIRRFLKAEKNVGVQETKDQVKIVTLKKSEPKTMTTEELLKYRYGSEAYVKDLQGRSEPRLSAALEHGILGAGFFYNVEHNPEYKQYRTFGEYATAKLGLEPSGRGPTDLLKGFTAEIVQDTSALTIDLGYTIVSLGEGIYTLGRTVKASIKPSNGEYKESAEKSVELLGVVGAPSGFEIKSDKTQQVGVVYPEYSSEEGKKSSVVEVVKSISDTFKENPWYYSGKLLGMTAFIFGPKLVSKGISKVKDISWRKQLAGYKAKAEASGLALDTRGYVTYTDDIERLFKGYNIVDYERAKMAQTTPDVVVFRGTKIYQAGGVKHGYANVVQGYAGKLGDDLRIATVGGKPKLIGSAGKGSSLPQVFEANIGGPTRVREFPAYLIKYKQPKMIFTLSDDALKAYTEGAYELMGIRSIGFNEAATSLDDVYRGAKVIVKKGVGYAEAPPSTSPIGTFMVIDYGKSVTKVETPKSYVDFLLSKFKKSSISAFEKGDDFVRVKTPEGWVTIKTINESGAKTPWEKTHTIIGPVLKDETFEDLARFANAMREVGKKAGKSSTTAVVLPKEAKTVVKEKQLDKLAKPSQKYYYFKGMPYYTPYEPTVEYLLPMGNEWYSPNMQSILLSSSSEGRITTSTYPIMVGKEKHVLLEKTHQGFRPITPLLQKEHVGVRSIDWMEIGANVIQRPTEIQRDTMEMEVSNMLRGVGTQELLENTSLSTHMPQQQEPLQKVLKRETLISIPKTLPKAKRPRVKNEQRAKTLKRKKRKKKTKLSQVKGSLGVMRWERLYEVPDLTRDASVKKLLNWK